MSYKTSVWLAFGFLAAAWILYLAGICMLFMVNYRTAHALLPLVRGTIVAMILLTITAFAFAVRARGEVRTAAAPIVVIVFGVLNIVYGLLALLLSILAGMRL